MGDTGLIPESGRSLVVGKGNPLQYSYWENPMDRKAWWGLQSMESQRVGHDLGTEHAFIYMFVCIYILTCKYTHTHTHTHTHTLFGYLIESSMYQICLLSFHLVQKLSPELDTQTHHGMAMIY